MSPDGNTDPTLLYLCNDRSGTLNVHILYKKFPVGFLLHDRIIKIIEQAMDADLLVIRVRIDRPELLCNLDEFPFKKRSPFERETEDAGNVKRCKKPAMIRPI